MAQIIVGSTGQGDIVYIIQFVNDLRVTDAHIFGHVREVFLSFLRSLIGFQFLDILANMEYAGIGNLVIVLVRVGVIDRHTEFWLIKAVAGQIFLRGVISYIVQEVEGGNRIQIIGDIIGVQREFFTVDLCEIDILRIVGVGAVLGHNDGIVLCAAEGDIHHIFKTRGIVVFNHAGQRSFQIIDRITADKIHIAVANVHIALLIHLAESAQLDVIALFSCTQMDHALRIIQTVLAVILYIFYDEGHTEGFKVGKNACDLILTDRESLVIVIEPAFLAFVEAKTILCVLPGQGLDGINGDLQDDGVTVLDFFLFFFVLCQRKGCNTGHHQNSDQCDHFFRPFHSVSLSFSRSQRYRFPDKRWGTHRSSAFSGWKRWSH